MDSSLRMESGLQFGSAVVWTIKLPALKSVSESSLFPFQGYESHLRLAYNSKHDGYVVISIQNTRGKEFLPFEVTTFIDSPRGPIYYYRKLVENTSGYLHSYYVADIYQKLYDLKFNGMLTFVCIFHGEVQSAQKHSIKDLNMVVSPGRVCSCPNRYCLENSSSDLIRMMEDTSTHDVTVKAGENTATAHKSVLAASSKVLAEMLQNKRGRHLDTLEIEGMNPEILKDFLHYAYTKKLETTLENAKRLYQAGVKFAMEDLKKQCTDFMVQRLTIENLYEYLFMADSHHDDYLKNAVISRIVDKHLPQQEEKWSSFCKDHPMLAIEVLNQLVKSRT